jgi:hypothetical protein
MNKLKRNNNIRIFGRYLPSSIFYYTIVLSNAYIDASVCISQFLLKYFKR